MEELSEMSIQDHIKIAIQSLSSMNPVLAPFINAYFNYKGKIAQERLLDLYKKLEEKIHNLEANISSLSSENKEYIFLVFERVSENVIKETKAEKRDYYLQYLISLFSEVAHDTTSFSKIELYLQTLENITELEVQIIKYINLRHEVDSSSILFENIETYIVYGSINSLKNKGLIISDDHLAVKYHESMGHYSDSNLKLSTYGKSFIEYCLSSSQ